MNSYGRILNFFSSNIPFAVVFVLLFFSFSAYIFAEDKVDLSTININSLNKVVSSNPGGSIQGPALNKALGLKPDSSPSNAVQRLNQAIKQAEKDAIKANDYATTVANAFTTTASTSTITASNMAAAQFAAGVQKTLIDFASALADLASVSDFFEKLAKGEMKESSLLENLDSIYEMSKDAESGLNNVTQNMAELAKVKDAPEINLANNPGGLISTADKAANRDGLTNINSLKSDLSDIISIYKDHKAGNPIDPRTLGQLIIRVGKGFAENDLKERLKRIKTLQRDLAEEQRTTSGLAGQLQVANDAKWKALDALKALRAALAALTKSNPELLGGAGGASQTTTGTDKGAKAARIPVTTKCTKCQPFVDQINQAQRALDVLDQKKATIEKKELALKTKKNKLKRLKEALARFDRNTADKRKELRESDFIDDLRGATRETENDINLRGLDRRKAINEITRLETEIEIEEGKGTKAELDQIRTAHKKLRTSLRNLRRQLSACEEKCETAKDTSNSELGKALEILLAEPSKQTGGIGASGSGDFKPVDSILDDLESTSLIKVLTKCEQCRPLEKEHNALINKIQDIEPQFESAVNEQDRLKGKFDYWVKRFLGLQFPKEGEEETWKDGTKYKPLNVSWPGGSVVFNGPNARSNLKQWQAEAQQKRDEFEKKLVEATGKLNKLKTERDSLYMKLSATKDKLKECEKQCASDKKQVQVLCTGGGCPSEPIQAFCLGVNCQSSINLNCTGSSCIQNFDLICQDGFCPSSLELNCDTTACDAGGINFFCGEGDCFGIPGEGISNFEFEDSSPQIDTNFLNSDYMPRANTTFVPRIQTCKSCQSIADQIYELDVRLNDLENGQDLWESVEGKPAEQEKLHKEQREKETERKKLAAKLELCQKKCPKPEYFYTLKPIEINCKGGGCSSEPITGTCLGAGCQSSIDLNCIGNSCTQNLDLICLDGTCPSTLDLNCNATACDAGNMNFFCGEGGCSSSSGESIINGIGATTPSTLTVNCSGQGCSEDFDIIGSCYGNTCPSSIDLNCPGTGCASTVELNCLGGSCTQDFNYDCSGDFCSSQLQYNCDGSSCDAFDSFPAGRPYLTGAAPSSTALVSPGSTPSPQGNAEIKPVVTPRGSSEAIPASSADLAAIRAAAQAISANAGACLNAECPIIDCATAGKLLQGLINAEANLDEMYKWLIQASDDAMAHLLSLQASDILTSEQLAQAIEAQGLHQFFHNMGSLLLDIAALTDTLESLTKEGLDPSKVKNLDTLYESLKTFESAVDTVADQGVKTEGTGPINDLTKDMDNILGLENTSIGSLKSDISDTLSAIDNFKSGKPWKGARNVGQIVGRVLKDISAAEMAEREARIKEFMESLGANASAIASSMAFLQKTNDRRFAAEDALNAVRAAKNSLMACMNKACGAVSLTRPNVNTGFNGWGSALKHFNGLTQAMFSGLNGSFSVKDQCPGVDTAVSLFTGDGFLGGGGISLTGGGNTRTTPVRTVEAKCPRCQSIANKIATNLTEMDYWNAEKAAIEEKLRQAETLRERLKLLESRKSSNRKSIASLNEGLRNANALGFNWGPGLAIMLREAEARARDLKRQIQEMEREIARLEADKNRLEPIQERLSELAYKRRGLREDLRYCEEEYCKSYDKDNENVGRFIGEIFGVEVIDVKNVTGNNPYNRENPISEENNANEETVKVINNIPISRLTLAGADVGCPNPNGNHYHGSAKNCNGVLTADPAPGGCGHGRSVNVQTIKVSSCPDL